MDGRPVECNAFGLYTIFFRFLCVNVELCGVKQSFCGNAAYVQAGSAKLLFFDQEDFLFFMPQPLRPGIPQDRCL